MQNLLSETNQSAYQSERVLANVLNQNEQIPSISERKTGLLDTKNLVPLKTGVESKVSVFAKVRNSLVKKSFVEQRQSSRNISKSPSKIQNVRKNVLLTPTFEKNGNPNRNSSFVRKSIDGTAITKTTTDDFGKRKSVTPAKTNKNGNTLEMTKSKLDVSSKSEKMIVNPKLSLNEEQKQNGKLPKPANSEKKIAISNKLVLKNGATNQETNVKKETKPILKKPAPIIESKRNSVFGKKGDSNQEKQMSKLDDNSKRKTNANKIASITLKKDLKTSQKIDPKIKSSKEFNSKVSKLIPNEKDMFDRDSLETSIVEKKQNKTTLAYLQKTGHNSQIDMKENQTFEENTWMSSNLVRGEENNYFCSEITPPGKVFDEKSDFPVVQSKNETNDSGKNFKLNMFLNQKQNFTNFLGKCDEFQPKDNTGDLKIPKTHNQFTEKADECCQIGELDQVSGISGVNKNLSIADENSNKRNENFFPVRKNLITQTTYTWKFQNTTTESKFNQIADLITAKITKKDQILGTDAIKQILSNVIESMLDNVESDNHQFKSKFGENEHISHLIAKYTDRSYRKEFKKTRRLNDSFTKIKKFDTVSNDVIQERRKARTVIQFDSFDGSEDPFFKNQHHCVFLAKSNNDFLTNQNKNQTFWRANSVSSIDEKIKTWEPKIELQTKNKNHSNRANTEKKNDFSDLPQMIASLEMNLSPSSHFPVFLKRILILNFQITQHFQNWMNFKAFSLMQKELKSYVEEAENRDVLIRQIKLLFWDFEVELDSKETSIFVKKLEDWDFCFLDKDGMRSERLVKFLTLNPELNFKNGNENPKDTVEIVTNFFKIWGYKIKEIQRFFQSNDQGIVEQIFETVSSSGVISASSLSCYLKLNKISFREEDLDLILNEFRSESHCAITCEHFKNYFLD